MPSIKEPIKNMWYAMPPNLKSRVYGLMKSRPMEDVLIKLEHNGVRLDRLKSLEVFGRNGEWHTLDYAYKISNLEIWEIDGTFKESLKRNFPFADIKITNSFNEVKATNHKFDMIVIDNPLSTFGDYCEHFALFPHIFNLCNESAIIILNVIPEINASAKKEYPYLFNQKQLQCRSEFYQTTHPESLSFEEISNRYKDLALENNFNVEWSFFERRNFIYYFVFSVKKLIFH